MANSTSSKPSFLQRHKWLFRLAIGFVSLILACCLGLFYLIHFESGTAFVWKTAKSFMGDSLSGDLIGGTLQNGIQLDNFRFKQQDTDIQIDQIRSQWHFSWHDRALTIAALNIGDIQIHTGTTKKDEPSTPISLPDQLALPIDIDLQDVSFKQLSLDQDSTPLVFNNLSFTGQFTQTTHTLNLTHLQTPWGVIAANTTIHAQAPFDVAGLIQMSGEVEQQPFSINSRITGTLKQLGVNIAAQGGQIIAGNAEVLLRPFEAMPLQQIKADIAHFDPRVLSPTAPEADFSLHADLSSSTDNFNVIGQVTLNNHLPGAIDHHRLPLKQIQASVDITPNKQSIRDLIIQLEDNGRITGNGVIATDTDKKITGKLNLVADKINLHAIHQVLHPTRLQGPINLTLTPDDQHVLVDLKDNVYHIYADVTNSYQLLSIKDIHLTANNRGLSLNGNIGTTDQQEYTINGRLDHLNPAVWVSAKQPNATINGTLKAQGKLASNEHTIQFNIAPNSLYGNIPIIGNGVIKLANNLLQPSHANLSIANNSINLKGSLGSNNDVLHVNIDAPNLAPLGYGLSGLIKFDGTFRGKYTAPYVDSDIHASNVHIGQYTINSIQGQAKLHIDTEHQLNTTQNTINTHIVVQGLQSPNLNIQTATLHAEGTALQHDVSLTAQGDANQKKLNLSTSLSGKLLYSANRNEYGWEGVINTLENRSDKPTDLPNIKLLSPLHIHFVPDNIQIDQSTLQINTSTLALQKLTYNNGEISSAGSLNALNIRTVLTLVETFTQSHLPVRSNMVVNGQWNFTIARNATGFIELSKDKGDLFINNGEAFIPMNLSTIHLRSQFEGQTMRLTGQIDSGKLGELTLQGTTSLQPDGNKVTINEDSKLNLKLSLNQPSLEQIGNLYGPQLRLEGVLKGDVSILGTVGAPLISGQITGNNLALAMLDQGISLNQGTINLVLANNILELKQFEFHGGKGTLNITGQLDLVNPQANMQAKAIADKLEIFASPTRQLSLSGQADLSNINRKLELDGKITIDNALFDIPKSSAPSLDDDVIIVDSSVDSSSSDDPVPESAFIPRVKLDVDLGSNFYFKDAGADLQLSGILHILREENQGLTAQGTIHAAGMYEAFGTRLNIEQGLINFQGPLNNPDINIRAMTQNQEVEAGVEVSGNANHPRIKLVSEPNVADEEKLSWLMFGKGSGDSDITQSQATSQALAAIGTYGGAKIVKEIGFDQFSIGSSDTGLVDDQVVSVGKSITRKISIGIEKALTGPDSVAKLTWNFSRRWSLVLRGGTINGINLTHNRRFDW